MQKFWVVREGLRLGPFDESEVLRSYESGALHADDLLVAADGGPGATIGEVFGELRRDILTSPDLMLEPLDGPAGAGAAAAPVASNTGAVSTFDAPSWTHDDLGGPAYAGFWVRLGALALDLAIVTLLGVAVLLGLALGAGVDLEAHQQAITAFSVVIGIAYFALQESGPRCATWGKRAFHLQVLAARDRTRIGFLRACARWIGHWVSSIFLIGYLIQPFTSRRQALHDLIAGTIVVAGARYSRALLVASLLVCVFLPAGGAFLLPLYGDFVVRPRVADTVGALQAAANAVRDHVQRTGQPPRSLAEAGVTVKPDLRWSRRVLYEPETGAIEVVLDFAPVSGRTFALVPVRMSDGTVGWRCRAVTLSPRHLPESCRE